MLQIRRETPVKPSPTAGWLPVPRGGRPQTNWQHLQRASCHPPKPLSKTQLRGHVRPAAPRCPQQTLTCEQGSQVCTGLQLARLVARGANEPCEHGDATPGSESRGGLARPGKRRRVALVILSGFAPSLRERVALPAVPHRRLSLWQGRASSSSHTAQQD